ncbi:MAG: recombinase family protein [Terracidiphilus sp.]
MPTKVAALFRVSTQLQAGEDGEGFATQRATAERIRQQYDLDTAYVIEYADVSGASVLRSPEIQRLVQLMESGQIRGVIAREFSRLMRPESFADYVLLQTFAETHTILYLPDGPIDFSNKNGRLFGAIKAAMAGFERSDILERVWAAKEEKRRNGELAQGHVVLGFGVGYDKEKGGFYYTDDAQKVRDAALDFLAGNQNYKQLAKRLSVTPRGMHLILRNPIWMGYRVIDKRRDPSPSGKYVRDDGRQAGRRKIGRADNEIIRVEVIKNPLLTEEQFNALQQAMNLKQRKHWRSDPNYVRRFTYNGFVICAACYESVQTALARSDYYVCKGRRSKHTCQATYMSRERLEAILDDMFAHQLQDRSFLTACVNERLSRAERPDAVSEIQKLKQNLSKLQRKRGRVVDLHVDGNITREDANERLTQLDAEIGATEAALQRCAPETRIVEVDQLVEAFAALAEWETWSRAQKRQLLAVLAPEIRVANYKVESLGLNPALFSNEDTHTGRGSWRPPA